MKVRIGRWVICSAKRIKKILETVPKEKRNRYYWQMVGIYDTRIFGIVFYRNGTKYEDG